MNKMEKAKKFVKDHWKALAIGGGAVVGGTVIFALTKKRPNFMKKKVEIPSLSASELMTQERIKAVGWNLGELTDLWNEGGCLNAIVNDITVDDLGKLGEECLKLESVTNGTPVTMVVGFLEKE